MRTRSRSSARHRPHLGDLTLHGVTRPVTLPAGHLEGDLNGADDSLIIDFVRAKEIWLDDVLEVRSSQDRHGEQRYLAYGLIAGRIITVVFTWRGDNIRLISARRARHHERKAYENAFGRGA